MNTDQQTRLEIMKALERDFPDRLLEDLLYMARYVEHGGAEQAEQTEPTSVQGAPRTWTSLADIPASVLWVKDRDGDQIKRASSAGRTLWAHMTPVYAHISPNDEDGPFSEVLS